MPNYVFPMPNATDSLHIVNLMKYINNDLLNGFFGITILFVIFAVMFISTIRFETPRALSFSMFITALTSYLMFAIDLVGPEVITMTTIITALSIFFLYRSR